MRMIALAAAAAAALAACSGPAEDAAHEQANAVDAAGERVALPDPLGARSRPTHMQASRHIGASD